MFSFVDVRSEMEGAGWLAGVKVAVAVVMGGLIGIDLSVCSVLICFCNFPWRVYGKVRWFAGPPDGRVHKVTLESEILHFDCSFFF